MAGEPAILLTETFDPSSGKSAGVTKLSTAGMAEAVARLRRYCSVSPGSTASAAGARGSGTK
jgi:hypothetical protein